MDIVIQDRAAAQASAREHLRLSGIDQPSAVNQYLSDVGSLIDRASVRGDGVAVYENMDLGHPELGERQYVTFGGPQAQLEAYGYPASEQSVGLAQYGLEGGYLPKTLPDIGNRINWRFQLVAIVLPTRTVTAEVDPDEPRTFNTSSADYSANHS